MMREFTLRNGMELPAAAFGTFKAGEGTDTTAIIRQAVQCGYRQIDTASAYKNESEIGSALRTLPDGVSRSNLIISGKVWNKDQGYEMTLAAFKKSCELLGIDYFDIYLIHWPVPYGHEKDYRELNYATWCAMEELYNAGKIKAVGVSNFLPRHLEYLMKRVKIMPMINQIEINPCFHEKENVKFCRDNHILVQAWSPFKRGDVFRVPELKQIAEKHGKTISQICLEWCLESGIQPVPKSSAPARMKENLPPFGFELDEEDRKMIEGLDNPENHAPFGDYDTQMNN